MNAKLRLLSAAAFTLWLVASPDAAADSATLSHATGACTPSENWVLSGSILEPGRSSFRATLRGLLAPVRGFSEALAQRRFALNDESRFLGEYWLSRALFDAKLEHIAFGGFAAIASRVVVPATAGIQLAAVECLMRIHARHPSIELPVAVVGRLSAIRAYATGQPRALESFNRATLAALESTLADPHRDGPRPEELLALLKGSGPYEDLAAGLYAASRGDHDQAVRRLDRFLGGASLPRALAGYLDSAHLTMARELYSLKQFGRAAMHFKQIGKGSNELAPTLEELSWAQLQDDRLPDAVGTAMTLQAGGLRHTYAPEAPMVMAMALNEPAQYPDSVRAISAFRKGYEKSYNWLRSSFNGDLYKQAVKYIRRDPSLAVPDRVAGEWVRTPEFIATQDELNLLFDEREATHALGKAGAREQRALAAAILAQGKGLPKRLRIAKSKMKEGDHLPSALLDDMLALKDKILHYRRLQQAAPVWQLVLSNHVRAANTTEKRLVAALNDRLRARNRQMLAQLEEIAENNELIEIEIYNGASQDLIWKNAHPDYRKIADKLRSDARGDEASRTWNWGRSPASLLGDGDGADAAEIWEDELGSFTASLFDNCESKDRYLALKSGR